MPGAAWGLLGSRPDTRAVEEWLAACRWYRRASLRVRRFLIETGGPPVAGETPGGAKKTGFLRRTASGDYLLFSEARRNASLSITKVPNGNPTSFASQFRGARDRKVPIGIPWRWIARHSGRTRASRSSHRSLGAPFQPAMAGPRLLKAARFAISRTQLRSSATSVAAMPPSYCRVRSAIHSAVASGADGAEGGLTSRCSPGFES